MSNLANKLSPNRFTAMSGKMAAIVGYIIDEEFTDPVIEDMVITSDGIVMAQSRGDCGMNDWIGDYSDLKRNWDNLLRAADDLTPEEIEEAKAHFASKFGHYLKPSFTFEVIN